MFLAASYSTGVLLASPLAYWLIIVLIFVSCHVVKYIRSHGFLFSASSLAPVVVVFVVLGFVFIFCIVHLHTWPVLISIVMQLLFALGKDDVP